jgi:hypothetical protein
MSKFKFICEEAEYYSPKSTRTTEFSAVLLDDVLKEFEMFLKGCGFQFDGNVIIEQETWSTEECNDKVDDLQYTFNHDYGDSFTYTIQATQESEPIPKKKKGKK